MKKKKNQLTKKNKREAGIFLFTYCVPFPSPNHSSLTYTCPTVWLVFILMLFQTVFEYFNTR